MFFAARDVDGDLVALPHVVGRTPASGIAVVDQFESNNPRVERIVGDQQAEARHEDGLAIEPTTMSIKIVAQMLDGDVVAVGVAPHDVVGLGERSEQCPHGLIVRLALAAELGLPSGLMEKRPGNAIDELGVDRRGGDTLNRQRRCPASMRQVQSTRRRSGRR